MKIVDITNEILGTWKVLNRAGTDNKGHSLWDCECIKCGRKATAPHYNLKRGLPICECSSMKRTQHFNKDSSNKFIQVSDKVTKMYDLDGNFTLIDTEDIDKVSVYYWRKQKSGYWVSKGNITLHRFIMNCPKGFYVDHKHHNKDDHRKSELRICTAQENQFNKKPKPRKQNLPQGVYETPYHKFRASIRTKDVQKHKNFDTLEEAVKQRREWEKEYCGEFTYNEI